MSSEKTDLSHLSLQTQQDAGKIVKGTLLVAGTCIGGGMLALPVEMTLGGFIPSICIYLLSWWLMASTGLLFLEISLWFKEEANIITMAEKTLGVFGKYSAWILYLFLFYMLTLAYVTGCGSLLRNAFPETFSETFAPLAFVLLFGPFVFAGARLLSRFNVLMMGGLFLSYFLFLFYGAPHVHLELLSRTNWPLSLMGLPVAFTAFAYQGIVPTIASYYKYDAQSARLAILMGSGLPFFAYVIWQALIMGIVPPFGEGSLYEALLKGQNAVFPLKDLLENQRIFYIGQLFSFFALVTSFFGVSLGLQDFLADGLKIEKTAKGRFFLSLLIFIPPLLVTFYDPNLFLTALNWAGGTGCALLLGFLPIAIAYSGRYFLGYQSTYTLFGGKPLLFALTLFVFFEFMFLILYQLGFFSMMQ